MNLTDWLVAELDDTSVRLRGQVLDLVPAERQKERMPGGNSITWATYHVARHATLALQVIGYAPIGPDDRLDGFDPAAIAPGAGLQEVEQPWAESLDPCLVDAYATSVIDEVREFLSGFSPDALDAVIDTESGLRAVGVPDDEFAWMYTLWSDQPLAFLVRWPLIAHITHHVGEMIGTRNQMGLSPFR